MYLTSAGGRLKPRLHWYIYLYQLLVQLASLVFDFPKKAGK